MPTNAVPPNKGDEENAIIKAVCLFLADLNLKVAFQNVYNRKVVTFIFKYCDIICDLGKTFHLILHSNSTVMLSAELSYLVDS